MSRKSGPGKLMNFKLAAATVAVLLLTAGQASAVSTWNLGADFSIASNPNGAWSYGSMPYLAGVPNTAAFTPYNSSTSDVPQAVGAGPSTIQGRYNAFVDPNLTHNYGAVDQTFFGITWSPGEVSLGPGLSAGDAITVARWTAPVAGLYDVFAQFQDNQANGSEADVHVFVNGVSVYSTTTGIIPEAGPTPYTTFAPLALSAGATIDFMAGNALGANNTELAAIVQQVPEPATWLLFGLGGLVVATRLKRRAR